MKPDDTAVPRELADLPVALLRVGLDGAILGTNPRADELLDATSVALQGKHVDELLSPSGRLVYHSQVVPALRQGGVVDEMRLSMVALGGRRQEVTVWGRAEANVEPPVISLAVLPWRDDRPAEDALLRVSRAADSAPAMLFEYVVQRDGRARFAYASAAAHALFGLTPSRLMEDDSALFECIHPDDLPGLLAARDAAAAHGLPWSHRCRARLRDEPGWCWQAWRAQPRATIDGTTVFHGFVSDITRQVEDERVTIEQQATRREDQVRRDADAFAHALLDAQPAHVAYWSRELRLTFANEPWLSWRHLRAVDAIGRTMEELLGSRFVETQRGTIDRVLAGEGLRTEISETRPEGGESTFWAHAIPYGGADGAILGFFVATTDMTEVVEARSRLEGLNAALSEADRFTRLVADTIPGRVAYWTRDRVCAFANRRFCDWVGQPAASVIGAHQRAVLGPERDAALSPYVDAVLEGRPQVFEREELDPDGSPSYRLVHFFPDERDGQVQGFIVLGADVTPLKQAQNELRRINTELAAAAERAQGAMRAKSAFLANMSHEIRTPLNAILGLVHLQARDAGDPVQRERLRKIDNAARHLLQVINNILDLSKVEAGRIMLEDVEFATDEFLGDTLELVAAEAREKNLELVLDACHLPPRLRGDPTRLAQALVNLLSNAVKFTSAGWVRLRVSVLDEEPGRHLVSFEVTDTGCGIQGQDLDHLFNPFEQADASTTRRHGGTGLGLALTRYLAELMEGEVSVESAPGQGSTFRYTAWLARASGLAEASPRVPLQGLRVLIVDDLPEAVAPLRDRLLERGVAVQTLGDGEAAIAHLREHQHGDAAVDVLLLDWRMPPLDGIETLRRVRELLGGDAPPAVLVSASDDPSVHAQAQHEGFAAVLVKPVTLTALTEVLQRVAAAGSDPRMARDKPVEDGETLVRRRHAGQRVLLAEDNPINQEVALELLRVLDLVVETADDGQAAVAMATTHPYDLVLMDVQMPVMDGLEATRCIRAAAGNALPIVAMTANAFDEDRQACVEAGMNDHLAKPVNTARLHEMLLRWLPPQRAGAAAPAGSLAQASAAPRPPSLLERLADVDHFDLVAALDSVGDREPLLVRLLGQFITSYETGCPELRAAAARGDRAAMARCAHSLRGACATVGALEFADRLRELELDLARPPDEVRTSLDPVARRALDIDAGLASLARDLAAQLQAVASEASAAP